MVTGTTPIRDAHDHLAEQAIAGMSQADRARLQRRAKELGVTVEQLVVQVVTRKLGSQLASD